jgi:hypothetical protein
MKAIIFIALSILSLSLVSKVRYGGPAPVDVAAGSLWTWTSAYTSIFDIVKICVPSGTWSLSGITMKSALDSKIIANYAGFGDTDIIDLTSSISLSSFSIASSVAFVKKGVAAVSIFATCTDIGKYTLTITKTDKTQLYTSKISLESGSTSIAAFLMMLIMGLLI